MASPLKTLDRILSKAGIGSRTDARRWIHAQRVRVNGQIIENPDHWADPSRDRIQFDGKLLEPLDRLYVLLYKPTGYITTYKDPEGRPTVYDLLQDVPSFVGTVGRLDEDTSGLLLLTNDHLLSERITNPDFHVRKTYLVKVAPKLTDQALDRLRQGVELHDGPTRPAEVVRVRDTEKATFLEITITEGRNRQVRRMMEAVEAKVLKLVRLKLGPLTLEGIESGKWRLLNRGEVNELYRISGLTRTKEERREVREKKSRPQRSQTTSTRKSGTRRNSR